MFRGVTILPSPRSDCLGIWEAQTSGALTACQRIIKFVATSKMNVEYKENTKMFHYQLITAVCRHYGWKHLKMTAYHGSSQNIFIL